MLVGAALYTQVEETVAPGSMVISAHYMAYRRSRFRLCSKLTISALLADTAELKAMYLTVLEPVTTMLATKLLDGEIASSQTRIAALKEMALAVD